MSGPSRSNTRLSSLSSLSQSSSSSKSRTRILLTDEMKYQRLIVRLYLYAIGDQVRKLGERIVDLSKLLLEAGKDEGYRPERFKHLPRIEYQEDFCESITSYVTPCHEYQNLNGDEQSRAWIWIDRAEREASEIASDIGLKEGPAAKQEREMHGLEAHAEIMIQKCKQMHRHCMASLLVAVRRLDQLIADGVVNDGMLTPGKYKAKLLRGVADEFLEAVQKWSTEIHHLEIQRDSFFATFGRIHQKYYQKR